MERKDTTAGMQIGAVAVRSGLSVDTVRFYEKQGLIPKPLRTEGGFRLYTEADIDRLSFVNQAQALGFSLGEIGELLLLRDTGSETCSHVHELLSQKVAAVQAKIADLRRMERQLKAAKQRCDQALAKECTVGCPVVDEITPRRKDPR